jgi:hypothetical protein
MNLRLRAGAAGMPGTWGFGLWNDPFGMGLSPAERLVRLPALPNTAWFFHASQPNYLSLRDDLPAQGWLAGVFRSPLVPSGLMALGAPGLALLALPAAARWLRRIARRVVQQDAAGLALDPTGWRSYELELQAGRVLFRVDGALMMETGVVPRGRLGVVIWIDNQYMRFGPDGRLRAGTLPVAGPAWIEVADISVRA